MIYRREANFPYPVLTPYSNSYNNCKFALDITLEENQEHYRFNVDYKLECEFLKRLIENDEAEIIFIIQSKDNKFYKLEKEYIDIPKSRISLSKRTSIQLLIKSKQIINFSNNNELTEFYNNFKNDMDVSKNSVLGFSNVAIFEGSLKEPLKLFEKRLNPNLKSDVDFELSTEKIIISYRNEDLQFCGMNNSKTLNNHYIYMGLQKALYKFVKDNAEEDETVYIDEIDAPVNGLDLKLYNLLKSKLVDEVNMDNIDQVIYRITDRVLEKHAMAIKGLYTDGN